MKLLDSTIIESLMHSENSEVPKVPDYYDYLNLESFTHIATDGKTLSALAKYSGTAARFGGCILDLSSLQEISAAVLMIFLRCERIGLVHFSSLKTLDLACARMLVKAVTKGTQMINFGFGFDLFNLAPEVIAELSMATHYGWTDDGVFYLFNEDVYKECAAGDYLDLI
jgi:hypothetical protein